MVCQISGGMLLEDMVHRGCPETNLKPKLQGVSKRVSYFRTLAGPSPNAHSFPADPTTALGSDVESNSTYLARSQHLEGGQ